MTLTMNLRLLLLALTASLPLLSIAQVGNGVVFYSEANLAFTPTTVDSTTILTVELGNEVGVAQTVSLSGLDGPFSLLGPSDITIGSEASSTLSLAFAPTSLGDFTDTLHAQGAVFGEANIVLSGEGIQVLLEWSADTLYFDTTAIGATSYQDLIITNVGNGTAAITDVIIDNDAFSVEFLDPYVPPTPQAPCYTIPANDYGGDFDVPYREFYLTIEGGAFPDNLYWNIYDAWGAYNYDQWGPVADFPICLPDNWNLPTNPEEFCCYNYFEFYTYHDLFNPVFTDGIVFTIRDEWNNEVWSFDFGDWPDWEYSSPAHVTTANPPAGPDFTPGSIGEGLSTIARVSFTPVNAGILETTISLLNNSNSQMGIQLSLMSIAISEVEGEFCNSNWTSDNSPYYLSDDIFIPDSCSFSIYPGTQIIGDNHSIKVFGSLTSVGAENNLIHFQDVNIITPLQNNSTILKHCQFDNTTSQPSIDGINWDFGFTGQIETWTAPATGTYRITAIGAEGGYNTSSPTTPGRGAIIAGDFQLEQNQTLQLLVGQSPIDNSDDAAGGGGTYVVHINDPLIIAGGGGGTDNDSSDLCHANATIDANPGQEYGAGSDGEGGYSDGSSGGGAGWNSNGEGCSISAKRFFEGGFGGISPSGADYNGGFGGGGCSDGGKAGGGGGFTGGGSGNEWAGGAGSLNNGVNQSNIGGLENPNTGHGSLHIELIYNNTANELIIFSDSISFANTNVNNYNTALSSASNLLFTSNQILGSGELHIKSPDLTVSNSEVLIDNEPSVFQILNSAATSFDTTFSYSGNIETLILPDMAIPPLTIEARGAQGGNSCSYTGGLGATIIAESAIPEDRTLLVLVGEQPLTVNYAAGGGGGSFVATTSDTPLVIAGGGSGATCSNYGNHGRTTQNGGDGDGCANNGGTSGLGGGDAQYCNDGTGGAGGFYTDGSGNGSYGSQHGFGFLNGGSGGASVSGDANGGFGGGGGTHASNTGGGPGGGYSGGGAPYHGEGYSGGGGGSFYVGELISSQQGANQGNGLVTIHAPMSIPDSAVYEFWPENFKTSIVCHSLQVNNSHFHSSTALSSLSAGISTAEIDSSHFAGLELFGSQVIGATHSQFSHSNSNGITAHDQLTCSLTGCTIEENIEDGIRLNGNQCNLNIQYCFLRSNGENGVKIGQQSSLNISNSLISSNGTNGIFSYGSIQADYCTIVYNGTKGTSSSDFSTINNSIIWFNGGVPQMGTSNTYAASYTNVQGINALLTSTEFAWGDGCIGTDPVLADSLGHLNPFSPCVDGGMPWEQDAHIPYGLGSSRADMGMYGGPANAYWGGQAPPDGAVVITDLFDIPQDQGGKLGMHFTASPFDFGGLGFNVTHYSVWRDLSLGSDVPTIVGDGNWEQIGMVPAQGFSQYGYTAETLVDATPGDTTCLSSFIVIAHTTDDNIYWVSDVAAACSYDNLAPLAPELDGDVLLEEPDSPVVVVSWPAPEEEDYAYTVIERADGMSTNVVGDTLLLDENVVVGSTYEYFGYHLDLNGNPSDTAYVTVVVGAQRDVIPLKAGWNLISLDRAPVDASVGAVMADLAPGNLLYVTGFDAGATFYDPSGLAFLNTMGALEDGYGYWVKVAADDTLRVEGEALPAGLLPDLDSGWNLVGYTASGAASPGAVFADLLADDALEYVTGFDAGVSIYDPTGLPFLNSLTAMENGFGYWVKTSADFAGMAETNRAGMGQPNPNYMVLNGTSNLGHHAGQTVAVVTASGETAAEILILEGGHLMTTPVYGSGPAGIRGIAQGEDLYLEFNGERTEAVAQWNGGMEHVKLDVAFSEPEFSVFPNPAADRVDIRWSQSKTGAMQLDILDATGRLVLSKALGSLPLGKQQVTLSVSDLSPGAYEVRLMTEGQSMFQSSLHRME